MPINVPVAESTALPMNLHLQDTNKVLIAGAFSTCEAVQQWTTASDCFPQHVDSGTKTGTPSVGRCSEVLPLSCGAESP